MSQSMSHAVPCCRTSSGSRLWDEIDMKDINKEGSGAAPVGEVKDTALGRAEAGL